MSNCPFCNLDPTPNPAAPTATEPKPADGKRPIGLLRRAWRSIQWLVPTTLLVLMPKCPMCVVGYVALFTGISITVSTARWIYILMPVLCLTSLAYLAVRLWRNRRRRKCHPQIPGAHSIATGQVNLETAREILRCSNLPALEPMVPPATNA